MGDTTIVVGDAQVDFYSGDFRVTVVPEPGSLALCASGLLAVLGCACWRQRQARAMT